MAMVKWDPLRELRSMQEEMNRLFEMSRARLHGELPEEAGVWQPPVDIYENEEEVVIRMEVPEVDLEDIQVRLEDDRLLVEGVRHLPPQQERQNYLRLERCHGPFRRQFALPPGLARQRPETGCDRGVLTIVLRREPRSGGK